jgi:hypothetical protein
MGRRSGVDGTLQSWLWREVRDDTTDSETGCWLPAEDDELVHSLNLIRGCVEPWLRSGIPCESGHSEVDGSRGVGVLVDLGEFVVDASQADPESFDFAEPSFAFGLGNPGNEVVADFDDSLPLSRIWLVHRTPQAGFSELWGRSVAKPLICHSACRLSTLTSHDRHRDRDHRGPGP